MDKNIGYVYILTNPCFKEDIVKIGITSGTVEKRMKELQTTGVPVAFEKYASFKTTKYAEVEKFMHRSLSLIAGNRVSANREFFYIEPEVALDYLMQIADLLGEGEIESCVPAAEVAKTEIVKRQAYNDREEWLMDNDMSLRNIINRFEEIGFGFHLGTSDLRIDITPLNCRKSFNCLMFLGKKDYVSFQPIQFYKLAEVCNVDEQNITTFLEELKPYLDTKQKNVPYENIQGYYNISYQTLKCNSDAIINIYSKLIKMI
jgi:hypothetical protein